MQTKPKLLVLTANTNGGGAKHIAELYSSIDDIEVIFAGPSDGDLWTSICSSVSRAIEVPFRKRTLYSLWLCVKLVLSERPDIIHTHGHGAGILARPLSVLVGARLVHTYHGLHFKRHSRIRQAFHAFLERLLSRITEAHICVGYAEAQSVKELALAPPEKLRVIENGVRFPRERRPRSPSGKIVLASISRISRMKGILPLVQSLKHVRADLLPYLQLNIYGDEQEGELDYYQQVWNAVDAGLRSVVSLKGYAHDISDVLDRTDVFVSASLWEGLPLTLIEVVGAGVPVILSDIPPHREIMDSHCDYFIPDELESIASLIETLLQNSISGDFPLLPAEVQSDIRKRYSLERMVSQTRRLYRDLLEY